MRWPRRGSLGLLGRERDPQRGRAWGERFHRARPAFPWVTAGTALEEAKGFSR